MSTLKLLKSLSGALSVGAVLLFGVLAPTWAAPITKQLNVTVVRYCDTDGSNCASLGPLGNAYFAAETDKIWAQAGIDINFIFGSTINDTAFNNNKDSVDDFTGATGGPGVTMYLVNDLVSGGTLFGEAWIDAGGLVINMSAVTAFNGGIGRLDTIAHEIGHNLGITHADASSNDELMLAGATRNIPNSIGQICPDAPCYDFLTQVQINDAFDSRLLVNFTPEVPEPGSLALVGLALLGLTRIARGRRSV